MKKPPSSQPLVHRAILLAAGVLAVILVLLVGYVVVFQKTLELVELPPPPLAQPWRVLPAFTISPAPGASSPPVESSTPVSTGTPSASATPRPTATSPPTATPSGGTHTLTVTSPAVSLQPFGPHTGTVSGGSSVYIHGTVTHGPSGCPPPTVSIALYPASAGSCSASGSCAGGAASVTCLNVTAGTAQYQLVTALSSSSTAGTWVAQATAGDSSGHGALSASASTTFTLTGTGGSSSSTRPAAGGTPTTVTSVTSNRPLLERVNEALRAAGSPITPTTSRYWQGRVSRGERRTFQALLDAMRWQLRNRAGIYAPRRAP